jgi:hypothetical protein
MSEALTPAVWNGPPGLGQLPDGSHLAAGDELLVTTEDLKSSHWKPVGGSDGGLQAMTRDQLNEHAENLGVEAPHELSNKQAVIDAIQAGAQTIPEALEPPDPDTPPSEPAPDDTPVDGGAS